MERADIVLIRMDKLGDLVVSMSLDTHPLLADRRVHWFIGRGLGWVAERALPQRRATEFARGFSWRDFLRIVKWLRKTRPRTAVFLHNPGWIACAVWWAGVPERIGRPNRWHSFLFVNVPVEQHRSAADRHESDYNFDLLEEGLRKLGAERTPRLEECKQAFVRLEPPNPSATLAARGLVAGRYWIVHPGMAGSALNWPVENYLELALRLANEYPVVITGTSADQPYLVGLESLHTHPNVLWWVDQLKPAELLDVLSQARGVVAPSTGTVHLAASLGTPVVGVYSPRKQEHPTRWKPKGRHVRVLVPDAPTEPKPSASVMTKITVSQVWRAVHELVDTAHGHVARNVAPSK